MKKIYLLLFLMLVAVIPASAQHRDKSREDIRKEILDFKLKFLAQEMDLKENQQQKFFDLYTQMENEKFNLYSQARRAQKKIKDGTASDADYEQAADMSSSLKLKEAQIEEKYNEKFKTFLSPKQLYKMKEAENKFREKLREMKKNKKQ